MKKIILDNSIKKGVIASVIASFLFIVFIEPILKLIFELLIKISDKFISGLADTFYQSASLGHRNDLDFVQMLFVIIFAFGFMSNIILQSIFIVKKND